MKLAHDRERCRNDQPLTGHAPGTSKIGDLREFTNLPSEFRLEGRRGNRLIGIDVVHTDWVRETPVCVTRNSRTGDIVFLAIFCVLLHRKCHELLSIGGYNMLAAKKLRQWAQENGLSYHTVWRWNKKGSLPHDIEVRRMPSGTLMLYEKTAAEHDQTATLYAAINHREELSELERQVDACVPFCVARGWQISQVIKEKVAGPGSRQPKLIKLLDSRPHRIVVMHRSRIARYQFELVHDLLAKTGCQLVVADESQSAATGPGVVEDIIEILALTFRKKYGPKKGQILYKRLQGIISASS
jgi:predicted site-specific integrase-resolvase